jgi:hypothetical protein
MDYHDTLLRHAAAPWPRRREAAGAELEPVGGRPERADRLAEHAHCGAANAETTLDRQVVSRSSQYVMCGCASARA